MLSTHTRSQGRGTQRRILWNTRQQQLCQAPHFSVKTHRERRPPRRHVLHVTQCRHVEEPPHLDKPPQRAACPVKHLDVSRAVRPEKTQVGPTGTSRQVRVDLMQVLKLGDQRTQTPSRTVPGEARRECCPPPVPDFRISRPRAPASGGWPPLARSACHTGGKNEVQRRKSVQNGYGAQTRHEPGRSGRLTPTPAWHHAVGEGSDSDTRPGAAYQGARATGAASRRASAPVLWHPGQQAGKTQNTQTR